MPFKYDVNKIFADLVKQIENQRKAKETEESPENNQMESPENEPETQIVASAGSDVTEDTHGGNEDAKEIEDSSNSSNDGENNKKENKNNKTENTENKKNSSEDNLQEKVEEIFEKKRKEQEDFKTKNRQEYLKKYILKVIKKISAEHAGIDKMDGSEKYDKKQMIQHMVKQQNYKILGDKYDLKDSRYVQFFIDTSGVYGSANRILNEIIPEIIKILEKQGYECYLAACGNGFYERDMVEDEYYGTRKTLEGYKAGKVSKIACPTPKTASEMANEAEFSVVIADFDGLSSICEMANLCQKDKEPYFLCTEDRFPWEDPTLHDWVNPELCEYNPELVYDVSMKGNPTLEQYKKMEYYNDYQDYEQDDEYEYGN